MKKLLIAFYALLVILGFLLVVFMSQSHAATIESEKLQNGYAISISGEIIKGDEVIFETLLDSIQKSHPGIGVVDLEGPGGNLYAV